MAEYISTFESLMRMLKIGSCKIIKVRINYVLDYQVRINEVLITVVRIIGVWITTVRIN